MTIASIPTNDRKERLIATAGQTVFAYDFPIYAATDLQVLRERAGVITTLVLGTDYTVAGANEQAGGTITLTAGALAGDIIVLLSAMPSARSAQFVNGGDLAAAALEAEFNRLRILFQQNIRDGRNALLFPPTDSAMQDLPPVAQRANRFLAFDQNGQPYAAVPTAGTVLDAISRLGDNMSGPLGFTPGTAAAPGLRPNNDNASGFFQPAPGSIGVAINGVQVARFINGGLEFVPSGVGAQNRTAQDKMRDIVSVKDFGAVGNGIADDAPAFQAAMNALIARGGGTLHVPFSVYRIKSRIQGTCNAQQHISIIGDGRYQSILDFSDGASLGIELSSTSMSNNQLPVFEVSKIGLITSRDNAGTALSFSYANPNNIDASVKVSEVLIAQNVDRISDGGSGYGYWTTGIYLNNARNSEVFDLHAYGEMNRAPNSSRGIWLAGESTAFVCSDSLLLEWVTGIEGTGTTEGIYLNNTDIVYCRYGARHNIATGAEPQFTAVGCSFNCANIGVWLSNSIGSVISDSFFFAASVLDAGAWPEWTGVKVDGIDSRFNKVTNCVFSKEIQRTGDTTIGIDFNQGRAFSASGNHFFGFSGNQLTFGVIVRSDVSNVRLGDDSVFEQVATHFANSGTNSIRQPLVQRGQAAVASGAVISFPQAFTETPEVVALHQGTNTAVNVAVSSPSTTGFTVHHNGGGSVNISWIAVGN